MLRDRTRPARLWHVAACHPQVRDVALGLLIAVTYLIGVRLGADHDIPRAIVVGDLVVAGPVLVLIALRRHHPVILLGLATVGAIATIEPDGRPPITVIAVAICVYTVASRTGRTAAWLAGAASGLAMYVGGLVLSDFGWWDPRNISFLAWTGMAVAAGYAVRNRRAYVAAVEERALRAEQSREQEARRQVTEERLRIARELHDVVAHHIALINVQAGVAAHVLRQQPDQAEKALGHVRRAARTVLEELSTVLDVLRRPDEEDTVEPTRGLDRLAGLLDSLAAAGLRVEHRQDGEARELPAAIDLAAYRIVQESLTNAQKHGDGRFVRLLVGYTPGGLAVTVQNPAGAAGPASDGGGHGLTGMRERAAALGGTLDATRSDDGVFTVRAFLPSPVRTGVAA